MFAGRDASLLDNKEEFNHACSLFIGQAGDLGCFKCPSCAKPYISVRGVATGMDIGIYTPKISPSKLFMG